MARQRKPVPAQQDEPDEHEAQVPAKAAAPAPVVGITPELLARIGGSKDRNFNLTLLETVLATVWAPAGEENQRTLAAMTAMAAFKPTDPVEGMLAAQMTAQHFASLECSRRALISGQDAEIAASLRRSAAIASRCFTELLSALDKKRSGGGQRITIQHLDARAIYGVVPPRQGGGGGSKKDEQEPHEPKALPGKSFHQESRTGAISAPLRREESGREPVQVSRDAESAPLPVARRQKHRPKP